VSSPTLSNLTGDPFLSSVSGVPVLSASDINVDTPNAVPFDTQESPVRRPRPKARPINKPNKPSNPKGKENRAPASGSTTSPNSPPAASRQIAPVTPKTIPDDSPEWFRDAVALFFKDNLGEEWVKCVEDWMASEQRLKFISEAGKVRANSFLTMCFNSPLPQRLSAKGRPDLFAWWTKRARNYNTIPQILDISTFSSEYINWWGSLERGGTDMCSVGGPNGFFVVMIMLYWWGCGFRARTTGAIDMDMSDALWREERNIWHEYVDNARQALASAAGQRYDRITRTVHQPVVPVTKSRKRSHRAIEAETAPMRGKCTTHIVLSHTNFAPHSHPSIPSFLKHCFLHPCLNHVMCMPCSFVSCLYYCLSFRAFVPSSCFRPACFRSICFRSAFVRPAFFRPAFVRPAFVCPAFFRPTFFRFAFCRSGLVSYIST
jgi:hypothetical protein